MSPQKQKYVLTVKCNQCTFQVTQEIETEPENLSKEKTAMIKQAQSIHKKHPELSNFEAY